MIRQNYMIKLEECNKFYWNYSFYTSNKDTVVNKISDNSKKLSSDLETQKELMKKLQEAVSDSSKSYNDLAKKVMESK